MRSRARRPPPAVLIAVGLATLLVPAFAGAAEPLLGWTDPVPATEVRALSGPITVGVRYGALAPATFNAELDGERITDLFHPEAGTAETVALPFIAGRNRLVLVASSPDGLEHLTLERRIVYARRPGDDAASERLRSLPELKHEMWLRETAERAPTPAPATTPAATPPPAPPL